MRGTARTIVFAVVVCLLIFECLAMLGMMKERSISRRGDFAVFYRAAVMSARGDLSKIYDVREQDLYAGQPATGPETQGSLYFYHPPFELLVFLPFAWLSYSAAFWLWAELSVGLLILSGYLLRAEFPEVNRIVPIPALIFVFFPALYNLYCGQDSALLLLLVVLSYRRFVKGDEIGAGVLLGLGLFKYQYIVPVILLLTLRRHWRMCAGCFAMGMLLAAISWAMVGTAGLVLYWQIMHNHGIEGPSGMPNLRGIVESFGGFQSLTILLSIALLAYIGLRRTEKGPAEFAAAIVGALLVSYHGHLYDFVLLLLPIFLVLESASSRSAFAGWPALFLASPLFVLGRMQDFWYLLALPICALAVELQRSVFSNDPQGRLQRPAYRWWSEHTGTQSAQPSGR